LLSENELVKRVLPFFQHYEMYREVKIFTRSIDLLLKKDDGAMIAIEFKLYNYQKAFQQLSDYQIVTDYAYLCIPKRNVSSHILQKLRNKGIGLYMYDEHTSSFEEIIKAKKSSLQIPFYRNYLFQKLENKGTVEYA
jgi:hypothetical protein